MIVLTISLKGSPPLPLWLTLSGGIVFIGIAAYAALIGLGAKKFSLSYFVLPFFLLVFGTWLFFDGLGQLLHR